MVNWNHGRCCICGSAFVIPSRSPVALQRFVFACPYCDTQMTGSFYALAADAPRLAAQAIPAQEQGLEPLEYEAARKEPGTLAVALNTEIPVTRRR
jgi:hypothetical protein